MKNIQQKAIFYKYFLWLFAVLGIANCCISVYSDFGSEKFSADGAIAMTSSLIKIRKRQSKENIFSRVLAWWRMREIKSRCGEYAIEHFKSLNISGRHLGFFVNGMYGGRDYFVSIDIKHVKSQERRNLVIKFDMRDFFDRPVKYVTIFWLHSMPSEFDDFFSPDTNMRQFILREDFATWIEKLSTEFVPAK